ncbi:hypothetical protein ACIO3O_23890 [Streptomyces sp. NPDC087440]|uniref:hypothetical protein n=1 Tax=Streptomyces sp. NPDC087440 TaxID=3365790 RepID=UPI003809559F
MTDTVEDTAGTALAQVLVERVTDPCKRTATRLLGSYADGYWLRRHQDEAVLSREADLPVLHRAGGATCMDFDAIGLLLLAGPAALGGSPADVAVLEIAASLTTRCGVQLGQTVQHVSAADWTLILGAFAEISPPRVQM